MLALVGLAAAASAVVLLAASYVHVSTKWKRYGNPLAAIYRVNVGRASKRWPRFSRALFVLRWAVVFYLQPLSRWCFRKNELSLGLVTLAVSASAYLLFDLSGLVVVTLFYASFFFFREMLSNNPMPELFTRTVSEENGVDSRERQSGGRVEVAIANVGSAELIDYGVKCKVRDERGVELSPWWSIETLVDGDESDNVLTLGPGESTEYVDVPLDAADHFEESAAGYHLADDAAPRGPYFVELRTTARTGYGFLNPQTMKILE